MKQMVLKNKKYIIILFMITLLSITIRLLNIDFVSTDYDNYLAKWFEKLDETKQITNYRGNYNLPYILILFSLTYLPGKPLYMIKAVSIIFDYILAIIGAMIVYRIKKERNYFVITYAVISMLPTVFLNSSAWGQCDSIYVSFCLLSILFLMDRKYFKSLIALGISVAFKLQVLLIFPLYIVLCIYDKEFKWKYWAIIPIINICIYLPCFFMKGGIRFARNLIKRMIKTVSYISANFPGIYNWFFDGNRRNHISEGNRIIVIIMVVILAVILVLMLRYILKKKPKIDAKIMIEIRIMDSCTMYIFITKHA